jgi:hypothetical protein
LLITAWSWVDDQFTYVRHAQLDLTMFWFLALAPW